jgi:Fe-S oxidoreductase
VVNAVARTRLARLVTGPLGVARERPLPGVVRRPLTRRLRGPATATDPVLFVDCFVQYQEPAVGEALAALLRAAGLGMVPLDAGCCGRTALSTGQIDLARTKARRALAPLLEHARAGRELLFIEPSCLSMVLDDWARLLPDEAGVPEVAAACRPALALVADLAAAGRLRFAGGGSVLLHPHCHEQALGFTEATRAALAAVPGLEVQTPDAGCCGMSGVFGYEAGHYELSVAMGERVLAPAVRAAARGTVVLATGTSCRTQVRDLTGSTALHPLELLAARLV